MAKEYKVWLVIEEYDTIEEKGEDCDMPLGSEATFDTYEEALAYAITRHDDQGHLSNADRLHALLSAAGTDSIRFSAADHIIINEIRTHFHETGEPPDTDDYDEAECIAGDIAAIEQILRDSR